MFKNLQHLPYDYILENELEYKFHFSPKIINKIKYAKNHILEMKKKSSVYNKFHYENYKQELNVFLSNL